MKTLKTSMKFLMCLLIALALAATTSCKKDSLEDAVLPETFESEQAATGTNGQNGDNGQDGDQGEQGETGSAGTNGNDGDDGENGSDGSDGQDGADGMDGTQGEQGETGAQGIQGETGAQGAPGSDGAVGPAGPTGETGANGTNGEDGNANVMVSDWITTAFSQTAAFAAGFSVTDANLTKELINNSLILGYGKRNSVFKTILPLPTQILNQKYQIELSDLGGENYRLLFRGLTVDGSTEVFNLLAEVKYFIIPANNLTGKSRSDFEKMSYEEIVAHFQLDF